MKNATSLLNIGHSGLSASRKRLATAGHNISNANTEGYSRQRAPQQATTPVGYGNIVLGTGTKVARVERIHDQYLEKKLGLSITDHNFHQERRLQLGQVEGIFNEVNVSGFNDALGKFFNAFRELSKRPENEAIRSIVRENAQHLARTFKRTKRDLNELQVNLDKKIISSVDTVNSILREIGELNVKIRGFENQGGETGDLRDERDLNVRKLSEFLEVRVYQDESGQFTVNAEGVGSLVAGRHVQELVAQKSPESKAYNPGGVELYFRERPSHLISPRISGGQLRALLQTRDGELKGLQQRIDDLAFNLANSVNAIHRQGFANKNVPLDENGIPVTEDTQERVTGIDFFKAPKASYLAADRLDISDEVKNDIRNIVTAWQANSPGDNRAAIAISQLQHSKHLGNGTASFEDFYLEGVGVIGTATKEAEVNEEYAMGILSQNQALKDKVSGVSIDEETANMIRYQHAFDASARVMSVADEMFKTVLGIKKL